MTSMSLKSEREKCAHLLRRFGLGASEAEVDYYLQGRGLKGAIDTLLDYERVEGEFEPQLGLFFNQQNNNLQVGQVQLWWGIKLLTTRRPLLEKMTLFWHDHFATSATKVQNAMLMHGQNETFRRNATGNFQELLLEVSRDPAMLFWLDNQLNVRGKPNENFAREIMELFTLGIGHYSEKDVQEAARAFTGWAFVRPRRDADSPRGYVPASFVARPNQHDRDEKEVLGVRGRLSGQDVVKLLCDHPQTSRNITKKLWEWFVYPNPEPAVIERFASVFRSSGLEIKQLLRAIMESPEFYSDNAHRAIYKNPVDFTVPTLRQLGLGEGLRNRLERASELPRGQLAPVQAMNQVNRAMGMNLLFPPDVDGWPEGAAWISTSTMVERIAWADRLFGNAGARQRLQLRVAAAPIFVGDPRPEGVVTRLISLFDAPVPESKRPALVEAAEKVCGTRVTQQNANATAGAVARLIFGSPEFQFA
jgi:uncharacterized protein (DUF1800 family)